MKIVFLLLGTLFIFSGCSTKSQNLRLRQISSQQVSIIRQQQAQINALQVKLQKYRAYNVRKKAQRASVVKQTAKAAPKKKIKLKKVEDNNYSPTYMYPGAKKTTAKAKTPTTPSATTVSNTMTKAECISMIGAEKFAKYTAMFGSEAASLKRCKILKGMKQ